MVVLFPASDIITVDAGGRLYKTSSNTLVSSGAHFFQAMLGSTGAVLAGNHAAAPRPTKRSRTDSDDGSNAQTAPLPRPAPQTVFVDCDPDIFADVLYFMRRNCIAPETKVDVLRLEKLKTEADFFIYDALSEACSKQMKLINAIAEEALKEDEPKAISNFSVVVADEAEVLHIPDGKVLYIVSATLSGECRVRRYTGYPIAGTATEGDDKPGCYLATNKEDHSGDFQLFYEYTNSTEVDENCERCCIAHVGLDQIHCGDVPMNMDFRQELRLCISPNEGDNDIALQVSGAGEWYVHYWIGDPHAIPQLVDSSPEPASKRRKLLRAAVKAASIHKKDEDEGNSLLTTMLTMAHMRGLLFG